MARRRKSAAGDDWLFPNVTSQQGDEPSSLLDVLDNVLNRGLMVNGDLILGVANVDLIYVKLSVLLAALDKVAKNDPVFRPIPGRPKRTRRR